jgi:hypothetical protein
MGIGDHKRLSAYLALMFGCRWTTATINSQVVPHFGQA